MHLLFGCRSATGDALYREEFTELALRSADGGGLTPLLRTYGIAVSRVGDSMLLRDGSPVSLPAANSEGSDAAAASGSSAAPPRRLYVQDLLPHLAEVVTAALAPGDGSGTQCGWVFISGSAKRMPSDVTAAIRRVAAAAGVPGWGSDAEAARSLAALERTKRLVVEAWS
jgi:sulfite reductase alpha subunit-like flavoprotein